jgi:hypothetical protein
MQAPTKRRTTPLSCNLLILSWTVTLGIPNASAIACVLARESSFSMPTILASLASKSDVGMVSGMTDEN